MIQPAPGACDPQHVDHVVLLVGFGKTKSGERRLAEADLSQPKPRPRHSVPYWLLKNSWGDGWGEKVSGAYGEGRTGQASPHRLVLMSSDFLGLFPAAPREQCLRHHQVPGYCPSGRTSQEAERSLLPSLSLPLSSLLLCQPPPC